jgi:hypothetical protein
VHVNYDVECDYALNLLTNRLFENFHNVFEQHMLHLLLNKKSHPKSYPYKTKSSTFFITIFIIRWIRNIMTLIIHGNSSCTTGPTFIKINFFTTIILINIRITSSSYMIDSIIFIIINTGYRWKIKSSMTIDWLITYKTKKRRVIIRFIALKDMLHVRVNFLSLPPPPLGDAIRAIREGLKDNLKIDAINQ